VNISSLSSAELRKLAKEKQKEEENTIHKTGLLKKDIYYFEGEQHLPPMYCSESEKNDLIEQFRKNFKVVCPAGMLFNCYIIDGEELWYSENNEICEYDEVWAKENLSDIKDVK
jgi:hypothetical protein